MMEVARGEPIGDDGLSSGQRCYRLPLASVRTDSPSLDLPRSSLW